MQQRGDKGRRTLRQPLYYLKLPFSEPTLPAIPEASASVPDPNMELEQKEALRQEVQTILHSKEREFYKSIGIKKDKDAEKYEVSPDNYEKIIEKWKEFKESKKPETSAEAKGLTEAQEEKAASPSPVPAVESTDLRRSKESPQKNPKRTKSQRISTKELKNSIAAALESLDRADKEELLEHIKTTIQIEIKSSASVYNLSRDQCKEITRAIDAFVGFKNKKYLEELSKELKDSKFDIGIPAGLHKYLNEHLLHHSNPLNRHKEKLKKICKAWNTLSHRPESLKKEINDSFPRNSDTICFKLLKLVAIEGLQKRVDKIRSSLHEKSDMQALEKLENNLKKFKNDILVNQLAGITDNITEATQALRKLEKKAPKNDHAGAISHPTPTSEDAKTVKSSSENSGNSSRGGGLSTSEQLPHPGTEPLTRLAQKEEDVLVRKKHPFKSEEELLQAFRNKETRIRELLSRLPQTHPKHQDYENRLDQASKRIADCKRYLNTDNTMYKIRVPILDQNLAQLASEVRGTLKEVQRAENIASKYKFFKDASCRALEYGIPGLGDLFLYGVTKDKTHLKAAAVSGLTAASFIGTALLSKYVAHNQIGTLGHSNSLLSQISDIENLDGIIGYAAIALLCCGLVRYMATTWRSAPTSRGEAADREPSADNLASQKEARSDHRSP